MTPEDKKPTGGDAAGASAKLDPLFGESDPLAPIRHSLRTPLSQIIGYAEMLREEAEDRGQMNFLPDLQKIHTAGGQLLAMINDALAPWKLEAGTVNLDSLRLEMRTPLNLIIGYSELCQELVAESGPEKFTPDLHKINAAAKSLFTLLDSPEFPREVEIGRKATLPGFSAHSTLGRDSAYLPPAALQTGADGLPVHRGNILIVDDNVAERSMLARRLERQGYAVTEAENGRAAMVLLATGKFDLILLDVVMPEMNGFEMLRLVVADPELQRIPVIMLSALDEIDSLVGCIEIGAEDYVTKPFNPVLLNARIVSSLEKKRLRDQEQNYLDMVQLEREKSERLLVNVLPKFIVDRLKQGETTIADHFDNASVMFADIAEFSQIAERLSPKEAVDLLNELFSQIDWLAELHGIEKIKTIGDSYLAVSGVPVSASNHASVMAEMALEMQKVISRFDAAKEFSINLRIGICSGPVIAGVIGRKKYVYDLWGNTVIIAKLLESRATPGTISVSEETYALLRDKYLFQPAGSVDFQGKRRIAAYSLTGRITPGRSGSRSSH